VGYETWLIADNGLMGFSVQVAFAFPDFTLSHERIADN
jgi:hypothetical protein